MNVKLQMELSFKYLCESVCSRRTSTSTAYSMSVWTVLAFSCLQNFIMYVLAIVQLIVHLLIASNASSNVIDDNREGNISIIISFTLSSLFSLLGTGPIRIKNDIHFAHARFIALNRSSIILLNEKKKNLFIGRSIYVLHLHSNFLQINFSQLYTPYPVPVRLMDISLLYLRQMSENFCQFNCSFVGRYQCSCIGEHTWHFRPKHIRTRRMPYSLNQEYCVGEGRMDVVRQSFGTIFMEC